MNTFDRILWRINGILLLVAILGITLTILYAFSQSAIFSSRQKNEASVITTDESKRKTYLDLGSGSVITGSSLLRCPLYDSESDSKFSSSGYGRGTRNYLFVEPDSLKSWWLLPNHTSIIHEYKDLLSPQSGDKKKVIATIYEVASKDTNGDSKIDSDDDVAAFFSKNLDENSIELTKDAKRILSIDQVSDTEALIVFQTSTETKAKTIRIEDGNTIRESVISLKE